jgi:cyclic pyranopterin phosphate synthase
MNPNLRLHRQALFNPAASDFTSVALDDAWRVYKNANLSIHVTDKCNADCAFCIAHLRYLNERLVYLKPEIEADEAYYERLDQVLRLTKAVSTSVSITGGEPSVNRKLPHILKILASHNVRKRTITTNGTGLFFKTGVGDQSVLDALEDYQLEHLNVSRAHHDAKENARIMVMNEKLMPEGMLEEIVQEARRRGIKTRLSCAVERGVSTYDDMMRYVEWGERLGVDNVIFRQLMQFDAKTVKAGRIPNYCKEQELDLMDFWPLMDANPDFTLYHQVLGYYYYVEVRKYHDLNVVSEAADLRIITSQLEVFKEKFNSHTAFEQVFHPNGNVCAGWDEMRTNKS